MSDTIFYVIEQYVLLGPAETVYFINEKDGSLTGCYQPALCKFYNLPNVFN